MRASAASAAQPGETAMPHKPATSYRSPANATLLLSRRGLMKAGLGATASGALLRAATFPALAQKSYPALGTFPAGVGANSVFVGGVMPLTGPYSASGKDMQLGFQLAIDHLNNGSRVTEQIPTLRKGKGVLGKKLEYQVADSETKPDTAV
jgi:ABC-type branched-subunit amino acid transport system substrate-binding protein